MNIQKEELQTKSAMKSEHFLGSGIKKLVPIRDFFLVFHLENVNISAMAQIFMSFKIPMLKPNTVTFRK